MAAISEQAKRWLYLLIVLAAITLASLAEYFHLNVYLVSFALVALNYIFMHDMRTKLEKKISELECKLNQDVN